MENLDRLLPLVLVGLVLILQPFVWLKIDKVPKVSKPGIIGPLQPKTAAQSRRMV